MIQIRATHAMFVPILLLVTVCLQLCCGSNDAYSQTQQFLNAPVVRSEIKLRWNASTKTMQWAADDNNIYRNLTSDTLFLTKTSVYVTYPHLNPLRVQANASVTAVADPAYATITKLIESLTGVANLVAPALPNKAQTPGGPPPAVAPCSDPASDIDQLRLLLYGADTSPDTVGKAITGWISAIDQAIAAGESGPEAIAAGTAMIDASATAFGQNINAAQKQWDVIKQCAANPLGLQRAYYEAAALSDQTVRIQQLIGLKAATMQLSDLLSKDYKGPDKWVGPSQTDYVISSEIVPTFDKMQTITAKVSSITLKVDGATSLISTDQQAAGSSTFNVRRYTALAPEIGVGAVFGTLKQPTYGTATNASGQTIVAQTSTTKLSVNPTILANFVCRCGTGLLVPMLQIGAATSKDLPAVLLGGGLRLFGTGKGDVAIGGGIMLGWYKDLQKLKVGDVVSGTSAINSDLGYIGTPKPGGYFAIQYKF
jgi:hypothetical protein